MTEANDVPKTQKAWVYHKAGQPADVLKLESDWPVPIPKAGELLIKVEAAGFNPIGWKFISNPTFSLMQKKPATPESDFSGTVVGGDLEGTEFSIGTKVLGITDPDRIAVNGLGTLAQYTVALVKNVVPKPEQVSWEVAAALPLAGMAAYHNLVVVGGLKQGMRVFINGGSGGVGSWAIQIAKSFNATIVTTTSPRSLDFVQLLSPTVALDYTQVDLPSHLASTYSDDPFDLILDTVGSPELYYASHKFLRKGGKYVDVAGGKYDTVFEMVQLAGSLVSRLVASTVRWRPWYTFSMGKFASWGDDLKECTTLLEQGEIKAHIEKIFGFDEVLDAYKLQMSGRTKGKVVVKIG